VQTIILRIYSGVHLGAQIELTPGTWTVGRDESCDIILTDKNIAGRHVALTLSESGKITAKPLDDKVTLCSDPKMGIDTLKVGVLYALSDVIFAIGEPNADRDFWLKLGEELKKGQQAQTAPASAPAEEATQNILAETPRTTNEATPEAPVAPTEAPEATPAPKKRFWLPIVLVVVLAFCATGLYELRPTSKVNSQAIEKDLTKLLHDAGFPSIKATYNKKGKSGVVLLTGSVEDDVRRGQLVEFSKLLKSPVALDVTVDSDYTQPLKESFNTLDFWPRVTLTKEATGKILLVSGYMRSNIVEEEAFLKAMANVPELTNAAPTLKVTRKIMHQDALERIVSKAFLENGVKSARLEYLPGRLVVKTVHTPKGHERLDKAIAQIRTLALVPLKIDTINLAADEFARDAKGGVIAAKNITHAPADPMKPAFKVVSVSGGVLKFVTLSNGSKYFIGGRMPGGFTLEAISFDKLVLSKNNKRINYPLKVKSK